MRILFFSCLFIFLASCAKQESKIKIYTIAFTVYHNGIGNLYTIRSDGSGLRRLTTTTDTDMVPVWSGDNSKIVFRSFRDGNYEIYSIDTSGNNTKRLTINEVEDGNPKCSPDGQWIAFESMRDGNIELYLMDNEGMNIRKLTD